MTTHLHLTYFEPNDDEPYRRIIPIPGNAFRHEDKAEAISRAHLMAKALNRAIAICPCFCQEIPLFLPPAKS